MPSKVSSSGRKRDRFQAGVGTLYGVAILETFIAVPWWQFTKVTLDIVAEKDWQLYPIRARQGFGRATLDTAVFMNLSMACGRRMSVGMKTCNPAIYREKQASCQWSTRPCKPLVGHEMEQM